MGSHNLVFPPWEFSVEPEVPLDRLKETPGAEGLLLPTLFSPGGPSWWKRMESMAKQKMGFDDVLKPPEASV